MINQARNSSPSPKTKLVLFLLVIILSTYIGYLYGSRLTNVTSSAIPSPEQNSNSQTKVNTTASRIGPPSLIIKQQALAVGTIESTDADTITVNTKDNQKGQFKLAANIMIYPLEIQEGKPVLGTKEKSAIKTNQKAAITLDLVGKEYLVTNITYIKN